LQYGARVKVDSRIAAVRIRVKVDSRIAAVRIRVNKREGRGTDGRPRGAGGNGERRPAVRT
jgi:hypothetical protein